MKDLIRRVVKGKPSEESRLISRAAGFPRYTPIAFQYSGFTIKATDMLSVAWQIKEIFGDERMKFACSTDAPLILDCGANVGISVLYFKRLFPKSRVICFEPDPNILGCLEVNLEKNDIQGVECVKKAVWTTNAGVNFRTDGADGGAIVTNGNAVHLPSIRLKDELLKHDHIDLLKIDIEGAETEVIMDLAEALQRVKYLYVEYHSFPGQKQTLHELLAMIAAQGFRYYVDRIGVHHMQPFAGLEEAAMDMQLDIHAIRD